MEKMDVATLVQLALKFSLETALALAKAQANNSIDDAIAALEAAKTKTADDYLKEAKVNAGV